MTAITHFSALPMVNALGWTLLHFCWQGAMVALVLACALGVLPSRASQLRYAVACAALTCLIALPLITFGVLATKTPPVGRQFTMDIRAESSAPALDTAPGRTVEPWITRCEKGLNRTLPAVVGIWLAGVLALLCRLNLGLMATKRWKLLAAEPAPTEFENVMQALRGRLGIERAVKLLRSAKVEAPTVIGWLRPVILIPLGCMMGLSEVQIEAILVHELAHIRRHDYMVNLLQSVVETVLFYHPAVWWVSSRIRQEREHCCDDLAVAITGDRLAYARALSFLEQRRGGPTLAGAFAATGGVLKMRIARLLGMNEAPAFPRTAAVILLVAAGAAAGLIAHGVARAQATAPEQSTSQNKPGFDGIAAGSSQGIQVHTLTIVSDDLPASERLGIERAYQGRTYPLEELKERIRQNLRDLGYAEARAEIRDSDKLLAQPPAQPVDISVRASAGARYRLDALVIRGAQAIADKELLGQFPIRPGDLFNATAIGKGLEGMKKLYAAKGYPNCGMIPRLKMDETGHTVRLIIDVNEGTPMAPR